MTLSKKIILLATIPALWLLIDGVTDHMQRQETNAQFAKLSRGVNIFYTVDEVNGVLVNLDKHLNQITIEDVERIKNAGLTHIRFTVSPYPLMHEDRFDAKRWQGENARNYLQRIHDMIQLFNEHDILVVLAVMPNEKTFERMYHSPEYDEEWVRFFHAWGKEFASHPASMFIFETLNEPRFSLFITHDSTDHSEFTYHYPKAILEKANARWIPLENRLVKAIHSQAPKHNIIVTADGFSDGLALALRAPSPYPYAIHAFHYYVPLIFTHQGAEWVSNLPVSQIGGLTYPSMKANCDAVQKASKPEHRQMIGHYCDAGWNEARHRKELDVVRKWSKQHGVPVWLSEFGAYPLRIDDDSMKNYYRDIQNIAGEYQFGRCAWEYVDWLDRFEQLKLTKTPSPADK